MFSLRCLNLLMSSWPLTTLVARLLWLRALCAVAEGAAVAAEADCVVTAAAARMAAFHGRDAQPRSLASVYGCFVTLFLGGGVRGVVSRVISAKMAGFRPFAFSDGGSLLLAIARCRLLVCDARTHDGALLRKIGRFGKGRRQFNWPRDICVPPDGFVFIADTGNCRVQVLTPTLEFHSFISTLDRCPFCVCANATVVCTIAGNEGVDVFSRVHGTFLRRLPNAGFRYVDAGFVYVGGMCLAPCNNYVAVSVERRIVVAALDGTSVFSIVHPLVVNPCDIAWSAHNEIFAAHSLRNAGFSAFSPDGTLLARFGSFTSHGDEYVSTDEDLCTRRVVVADPWMQKLVEFSIEGAFQGGIRDVPRPLRVACGPADELVVTSRECTQVLDHDGRCVMAEFQSTAAALHGTTLFL